MSAMQEKKSAGWKVGIAAIAAAGLAITGLTAANAATIQVVADDVVPYEIGGDSNRADYNYHEWHIGNVGPQNDGREPTADEIAIGEASFNFDNPAGITLYPDSVTGAPASTQLFKGNHIDEINVATPMTMAELEAFIDGISINVVSGSAYLQIAGIFAGGDPAGWTTLHPFESHGTSSDFLSMEWTGTGSGTFNTGPYSLTEATTAESTFLLYGVGIVVEEQTVVESLTFDGNTYMFAVAQEEEEVVEEDNTPTPPDLVDTARK